MADPLIRKGGMAAMCLQEEPIAHPLISDISAAISFLAVAPPQGPLSQALSKAASLQDHKHDVTSLENEEESEQEQKHAQPNKNNNSDYSSEEYDEQMKQSRELRCLDSRSNNNINNKKSIKMQSLSDSRSKNKKQGKVETLRNSCTSSDDDETLPPPIHD